MNMGVIPISFRAQGIKKKNKTWKRNCRTGHLRKN